MIEAEPALAPTHNEFRARWRQLLGASIGVCSGVSLNFFSMSIFAPRLIRDLHWSKADFALIGSLSIFSVLVTPLAGWLVDRYGTRAAAIAGYVAVPLGFVAFSTMSGNFYQFLSIYMLMSWFGLLTSGIVFCRVIIENFDQARGLALALMMSASPLGGVVVPLIIAPIIDAEGWRHAYLLLAMASAIGGAAAILLVGPPKTIGHTAQSGATAPESMLAMLRIVARDPVFLLMMAGMFLVNMPRSFATSQLKVAVLDYGFPDAVGTMVVSVYALGTIFGRCISGFALDRAPTNLVALVMLSIPALGYLFFIFPVASTGLLMAAVFIMAMAFGSEFDIGAYLISRNFPARNFSKLYAAMDIALGTGSALGAVIMSAVLSGTSSYKGFLLIAGIGTLAGAALLGLIGRARRQAQGERGG